MGSFAHPRVFNSLDLETIDLVYEAAWAQVEAREPFRNREKDDERRKALRKLVLDHTGTGRVDFDALFESVVTNMPDTWSVFTEGGLADRQGRRVD
jgi:hypothetical protein